MHRFKHLIVFTALALAAAACNQAPPKIPARGEVLSAQVQTVKPVTLTVYAAFPGTVISADKVAVASQLTGYVYDLKVHEGERIAKGALLFAIDPTDVKAEIQQARAELSNAKATLANARTNYERYKEFYRQKSASQQEYDQMVAAWKVARGSYRAAEAALKNARSKLKYAEVRAPFDALVVSKSVENGQLAVAGTPLLMLESPESLQVEAQVSDRAFRRLGMGQKIPIRFEDPNGRMRTVKGTVKRLVPAANPVTHTHLVKIELPAGSGAYIGEYALVEVPIGQQKSILAPDAAIHTRAGITGIFVVTDENRAQFRMVTAGKPHDSGRVILSGIFPGDRIIVSADAPLVNGVEIRTRSEGNGK